jgi:Kef-type K+ transport system membrane component KefB
MGHVPNFTNTIFPTASIPNITTAANIGLVMFLFIVGMEVDLGFVKRNLTVAATVSLFGMCIPFGLGYAVAVGLYNDLATPAQREAISFGVYGLFIGVALAITALPVLARILTELGLLRDRVGVIVLAAGIGNDLLGWVLLALCVTLANAADGINAFYIVLMLVGWFLLLMYLVKPCLHYFLKRKGSFESGPSQIDIAIIVLLLFCSAFFTDIIGVHPIFGAFLLGVAVPRDNNFVVHLTEKIEDFISVILLPLYFALAGLNVNIGLLNNGTAWGYVFALIFIALGGKVFGATIAARITGALWRESLAVGALMSCKGIVEIVVLTVGLNAKILSQEVFSMFIVMTLVTTCLTTPMTLLIYPEWYRQKVRQWRNDEINWDGTPKSPTESERTPPVALAQPTYQIGKVVVLLNEVEPISVIMVLIQILSKVAAGAGLHIKGVRIKEISKRTADLIQATAEPNEEPHDDVLNVMNTFTQINNVTFSGVLAYSSYYERGQVLCGTASTPSDLLLVTTKSSDDNDSEIVAESIHSTGEFVLNNFHKEILRDARCHVGLFVDKGFGAFADRKTTRPHRKLYVPFFGDRHDNLALAIAVQLVHNQDLELVVDVIGRRLGKDLRQDDEHTIVSNAALDHVNTVYESLDDAAKRRVTVNHTEVPDIVDQVVYRSQSAFGEAVNPTDLVLVGARASREMHGKTPDREILGDVANGLLAADIPSSIMIIQESPFKA